MEVVAIALGELLPRGKRSLRAIRATRHRLKLLRKTKLLVFGCGTDGNLEYAYRNLNAVANELSLSGADAVSGLAFSVYYHRPPIEGLINEKRNLWTFRFFRERGIEAFPMIAWRSSVDIERWVAFLQNNPGIAVVGIDFQDAKDESSWRSLFEGFQLLATLASPRIRYVAYGISSETHIRALASITSRIHVVSEQALIKAAHGVLPRASYRITGSHAMTSTSLGCGT